MPVRAFNFAAGPATLPLEVLEQVRAELTDWRGSGSSVMEVSHRSKAFIEVARGGGAAICASCWVCRRTIACCSCRAARAAQFSAIPLNLASAESVVDYIDTGVWSKKALAEARRYCRVNVAADEAASSYCTVPDARSLALTAGAAYLHYTPNETIGGVEFPYIPDTGGVPLVADMSSTLLSRPFDVSRCALIYAGAQKNIGPAGLCVVIVRDDLLGEARAGDARGVGLPGRGRRKAPCSIRRRRSPGMSPASSSNGCKQWAGSPPSASATAPRPRLLYAAIDASGFYRNPVAQNCRSWMNVPVHACKPGA